MNFFSFPESTSSNRVSFCQAQLLLASQHTISLFHVCDFASNFSCLECSPCSCSGLIQACLLLWRFPSYPTHINYTLFVILLGLLSLDLTYILQHWSHSCSKPRLEYLRERNIAFHACPDSGLNAQPGYVPWPGIEPTNFLVCGMMANQLSHSARVGSNFKRKWFGIHQIRPLKSLSLCWFAVGIPHKLYKPKPFSLLWIDNVLPERYVVALTDLILLSPAR